MTTIEQKLEQLHLVETEYDAVETNLKSELEAEYLRLMDHDLYYHFKMIQADYEALLSQASEQRQTAVNALHDEIKAETLQHGETVKAAHYMAVYAQPKPAWDNGKLEGFALVHPEILQCRTEKPPYVSLRKLK